ncbi:MAG: hypothetical protein SGJ19_01440 [Planctomycetia bacterium]|nr:hypothetical protein [Planctomycetia bacterium]
MSDLDLDDNTIVEPAQVGKLKSPAPAPQPRRRKRDLRATWSFVIPTDAEVASVEATENRLASYTQAPRSTPRLSQDACAKVETTASTPDATVRQEGS